MDFAKNGCAIALGQLSVTDNMDDGKVAEQLRAFWNKVYDSVSVALGGCEVEKNIYKILVLRQLESAPIYLWKTIVTPPAPKPVKESKLPLIQKILLALAMAVSLAGIVFAAIKGQKELCIMCAAVLGLALLTFLLFTGKSSEIILPPTQKAVCHWDNVAINKYLTDTAIAIDADASALIPRSDNKPEALELVKTLLKEIYQGALPLNGEIHSLVRSYLIRYSIEIVEYSPETAGMFTTLPANGNKTLAPALVSDGHVLSMGEACVKK